MSDLLYETKIGLSLLFRSLSSATARCVIKTTILSKFKKQISIVLFYCKPFAGLYLL